VGDSVEMICANGNQTFNIQSMVKAKNGEPMLEAPGSGHIVRIPLPVEPSSFALIAKNIAAESA